MVTVKYKCYYGRTTVIYTKCVTKLKLRFQIILTILGSLHTETLYVRSVVTTRCGLNITAAKSNVCQKAEPYRTKCRY